MLQNLYSVTYLLWSRHVFPELLLRCYSCQSFLPSFLPSFLLLLYHTEERKSSRIFTRERFFSWLKQARTKKRKIKVSEKGVFSSSSYIHISETVSKCRPSILPCPPLPSYPITIPSHTLQLLQHSTRIRSPHFLFSFSETRIAHLTSSSIQSNENPTHTYISPRGK